MTSDSSSQPRSERVVGDFNRILEPDSPWRVGGFQLPDGSTWQYREPDAVVLVRNGWLQVAAVPFTRGHDRVPILDNAKHMYFSRERFAVPEGGRITFEIEVAARTIATRPGDVYDGYVSWNLLDLTTGWAFDFYTGGDGVATVYGRLPFPGVTIPQTGEARAFCIFNELHDLAATQGQVHAYRITYDQGADTVEFEADGRVVDRYEHVPDKLTGFAVALGLMTEIDIEGGKSVSCHGQGVIGRWSPMRVATEG
ncbi:MAG: hypothetical protein IT304_00715 [Dehalococcoidia bacterium]|nr:hypothetical protein [Dehalococcoidia bacterium]